MRAHPPPSASAGSDRRPGTSPCGRPARSGRYAVLALWLAAASPAAQAWGDEGHQVVGAIASRYLQPAARRQAYALLAADADPLTAHDFVSATNWADRYRESDRNGARARFLGTRQWHFIDIERRTPDLAKACFGHPPLPAGVAASAGPAAACAVDKIEQFSAELADPTTSRAERRLAPKFLLHLVGDMHQPLHSSDDHDGGGNAKRVIAAGSAPGSLHGYWDTPFVRRRGESPASIADGLLHSITPAQVERWSQGGAADWAAETAQLARDSVYAPLPAPDAAGVHHLPASYVAHSGPPVATQLSRAGVRLATLLNRRFGAP